MKLPLSFIFAAVAVAVAFAHPNVQGGAVAPRNKGDTEPPGCYWEGTAPFCKGQCKANWKEIVRTKCGDGHSCTSGSKAYCCPESVTF